MTFWVTENRKVVLAGAAVIALALLRLCHIHFLWSDEDYHLAAALSILHGKVPYRDFWYDKPPLSALYYLLIGARSGVALRLLDALTVMGAAYVTGQIAGSCWGKAERVVAAVSLAFFWAFYLPAATIPFAADAIMLLPHVAAIYFAMQRRALLAGGCAGLAFLANTKAVFVLAACALWCVPELLALTAGFAVPLAVAFVALSGFGAWPGYWQQVWRWGLRYAGGTPAAHPLEAGAKATLDWLGFHCAVVLPAAFTLSAKAANRWKLSGWLLLSFAAVCVGARFAPRYYLQLLPPVIVLAARGYMLLVARFGRRVYAAAALLWLLPFLRFAPRYAELGYDLVSGRETSWADVQMDVDSRHVADQLQRLAAPGDTLFVWGYRPDIYVFARLVPDGGFEDSQPLTGVPADRHLTVSNTLDPVGAAANRRAFLKTQPTFFVDGLGQLNPALQPSAFPEVRTWLAQYELVGRTGLSLVYKRR